MKLLNRLSGIQHVQASGFDDPDPFEDFLAIFSKKFPKSYLASLKIFMLPEIVFFFASTPTDLISPIFCIWHTKHSIRVLLFVTFSPLLNAARLLIEKRRLASYPSEK